MKATKEPLDEGERGEWKSWLKTQHYKNQDHGILSHNFMSNRRGESGTVTAFIFLGSSITVERCLLLGRKIMTNLESVLLIDSRAITLLTEVHIVKTMIFSMCESWTIKRAEHRRINAFELWCWRRLVRVPWTARSNQSTLKDINPEYSFIHCKDYC